MRDSFQRVAFFPALFKKLIFPFFQVVFAVPLLPGAADSCDSTLRDISIPGRSPAKYHKYLSFSEAGETENRFCFVLFLFLLIFLSFFR